MLILLKNRENVVKFNDWTLIYEMEGFEGNDDVM